MKKLVPLLALVMLISLPSLSRAQEDQGLPRNAFLFEARLAFGSSVITFGGGTVAAFQAVPSLLVGARLVDRLQIGLGFGFLRTSAEAGTGTSANNIVTFAPTAEFDLVKSRDNRVAFYGKAALPLGPVINCPGGGASCDNNFAVGFDLGLGARYALHRMFSLGLEAGVGGTFIGPQRNNTVGIVTVYGGLVGSFYAGK